MITAVDVGHAEQAEGLGVVYAGTEPSAVFRSDTGGDSWVDLVGLRAIPSAHTWSFPPRPHTHHVRWIEADESVADRVYVAIEAGALVRTFDSGRTWHDRVRRGPYDTHTAVKHPLAPGRIYSAAGDGYFESTDGGDSWRSPDVGLKHLYLVGIAVDPSDPDTVIVSATEGPGAAYNPRRAESYVYRKTGLKRWELAMSGLPEAKGTTVGRFAMRALWRLPVFRSFNRLFSYSFSSLYESIFFHTGGLTYRFCALKKTIFSSCMFNGFMHGLYRAVFIIS